MYTNFINLFQTLAKIKSDLENTNENISIDANNCINILDILLNLLQNLSTSKVIIANIYELPKDIGSILVGFFQHCKVW